MTDVGLPKAIEDAIDEFEDAVCFAAGCMGDAKNQKRADAQSDATRARLRLVIAEALLHVDPVAPKRSACPSCTACREGDHVRNCGGPESGCGCAAEGHGDAPMASEPPEPRELAQALYDAMLPGQRAVIDAPRHTAMRALLARIPPEWLR